MSRPDPNQYCSDAEVQDLVNNAVIGMLNWKRLKNLKAQRGNTLRDFTKGLVASLTEECLIGCKKHFPVECACTDKEMLLPPEELAIALLSSTVLVMYKYIIPNDKRKKNFLASLVEGPEEDTE